VIPVNEPLLGPQETANVLECLQTGWISSAGRFIEEFERGWAAYCGRKYGIAVCNGTAALEVAIDSLQLEPGDEVIMPASTIISCALAVVYGQGVPVLVDSEPMTWCIDVNQIERKITPRTRAIMPVHIYGHPVDMDAVTNIAKSHGLAIIEDAAEAHGAEYLTNRTSNHSTWQRCGSFGALSCFSFYANKPITTGEGGMVLTDDETLAERARSLRNLCFQSGRRFFHEHLGHNFRITNLQAAIGLAQIGKIDDIVSKKRWIGREYTSRLKDIDLLQLPTEESWARSSYWMYGIVLDEKARIDAAEFAQRLFANGVETRPFFLGMHEQPAFHKIKLFAGEHYPVAERIARRGLYLPSGLALTEEQLTRVCEVVRKVLL